MDSFSEVMEQERQRLNGKLEELAKKRFDIEQEEGAVHVELSALTAYFDAKMGKVAVRVQRNTSSTATRTRGPRQVGLKPKLIELVNSKPEGISKQDILAAMDATESKTLQNSIANALVQLKKAGNIASGERGMYVPSTAPSSESTASSPKTRRVKKTEAATA